jgi:hypothetical protein
MVPIAAADGLRIAAPPSAQTAAVLGPAASWDEGDFGAQGGTRSESVAPPPASFAGVRYYDVERDYLPGVQRAVARPERTGQDVIDLPVASHAEGARQLARAIQRREAEARSRHFVRLAELDPSVFPGARLRVPGRSGIWAVMAWEWREKGVEIELHRLAHPQSDLSAPASHGLPWAPLDRSASMTLLDAFELPWDGHGSPDTGSVHVALSASEGRWAGAALYADSAGTLVPLGPGAGPPAVVGTLVEPLSGSPSLMVETGTPLELELASDDMLLAPAAMAAVALGRNRLILGEEIVQFLDARQTGPRRWALNGLLRGRLGTEHAARLDERIISLEPEQVASITRLAAIGSAEDDPVYAPIRARGTAAAPPSPVHPRVTPMSDGGLDLAWTRRARGAWRWSEGTEIPLVEASELYEVGVGPVDAPVALWQTSTPSLTITGSERADLAAALPGGTIWVRQVGTLARSRPLALKTLP